MVFVYCGSRVGQFVFACTVGLLWGAFFALVLDAAREAESVVVLIGLDVGVSGTVSRCEGFEGLIVVIGVVLCFEREALGDHIVNFFCFCILAIEIVVVCDSVLGIFVFWVGFIRFVGKDGVGG